MGNPMYGQNKFDSSIEFTEKYLDFCAGWSGNLDTIAGISVSEAEAVAALAAVSSADQGDSYAATLITGAVNTSATTGAAGTIHLPTATRGEHLVLDFADVHDSGTNALTLAVNGGALLSTGTTLISGGVYSKQAIGSATGVAGNTVETAGTVLVPTSVNLIYTATAANNFLGTGSRIHFFCPKDNEWLVNVKHVQQGTGATGAFTVS